MIEAIRGKSYRSDIAIDTIELFDSPCIGKETLYTVIDSDCLCIVMVGGQTKDISQILS